MSREWKQGDVVLLAGADPTAEGVRAIWQGNGWATCTSRYYNHWQVNVRRQLVVIDPEDRDQVERLRDETVRMLRDHLGTQTVKESLFTEVELANAIQAALREFASPTPPKPDEPTGLGAVVVDREGADWHRTREGRWIAEDGLRSRAGGWAHIDAITVLTPGITPPTKENA